MPVDRTGLLSDCLYNVDEEHPVPSSSDIVTLEQCINARCEEIAKLDNLSLMWSGGIDSTLVFYALINHGIPFECVGDHESIAEYPELADQIMRGQFSGVEWVDRRNVNRYEYYRNRNLVTGELGDQMVGTDKLIDHYSDKSVRLQDAESKFCPKDYARYYDAIRKVLGKDDLTVAEFAWAMNFLFKFTYVKKRMKKHFALPDHSNLHHLFSSDMFQQWALQNYTDTVHFDEITDYKMPYKDYIYSHNGDDHYRINKIKIGSLKPDV